MFEPKRSLNRAIFLWDVPYGDHSRDTSRTDQRIEQHLQTLIDLSKTKEADKLRTVLHPDDDNEAEIPQCRYNLKHQRPDDLAAA